MMLTEKVCNDVILYYQSNGIERERLAAVIYPRIKELSTYIAMKHYTTSYQRFQSDMVDAAVARVLCSQIDVSRVKNIYNYIYQIISNSYKNYIKLKQNRIIYDCNGDLFDMDCFINNDED